MHYNIINYADKSDRKFSKEANNRKYKIIFYILNYIWNLLKRE